MTNDIRGFAAAQDRRDRQEPPDDGSQSICGNCGEKSEDHVYEMRKNDAYWSSNLGVCPDEAIAIMDAIRDNEFVERDDEPDPDRRRDEREDR